MERKKRESNIPPVGVFGWEAVLSMLRLSRGTESGSSCQAQCLAHSKPFPPLNPVFCESIVCDQPNGVQSVRTCPVG